MTQFICPYCESEIEQSSPAIICPHCGLYAFIGLNNTKESILKEIEELNHINSQLEYAESYELYLKKLELSKSLLKHDQVVESLLYLYNNITEETIKYLEEFIWDIMYFDTPYYDLSLENVAKHLKLKAECIGFTRFGMHKPLGEDLIEELKTAINSFDFLGGFSAEYADEMIWCYKCLLVLEGEKEEYLWKIIDLYDRLGEEEKILNYYNQIGELSGNSFNLYYHKSLLYHKMGKTKKSIIASSLAVNQKDKDSELIHSLFETLGFDYNEDTFGYLDGIYKSYVRNKYALDLIINDATFSLKENVVNYGGLKCGIYEEKIRLSLEEVYDGFYLMDEVLDADLKYFWFNKGMLHLMLKETKAASECFDKVIAVDERWAPAYIRKAQAISTLPMGDYGYWFSLLNKGLFYDPDDDFGNIIIDTVFDKPIYCKKF